MLLATCELRYHDINQQNMATTDTKHAIVASYDTWSLHIARRLKDTNALRVEGAWCGPLTSLHCHD